MSFLKKIFFPSITIISFLLFFYVFYKSEIFWGGQQRGFYLFYYILSLILFFFSIIAFFLSAKIKEYLAISCLSVVASLYLFETYLTFNKSNSKENILKEKLYNKQTGKKWDNRRLFEIEKDLKKIDEKIVVRFYPIFYIKEENSILPLSGISNSKTIHCNENGYYSMYKSDRYGFNNPNEEWDNKKVEYVLVGDSYPHGACVNRPNDISSVLRKLSGNSVINLGFSGNGPLLQYAALKEYLKPNVKKVLWLYYEGNDLTELLNEKKNRLLKNYLDNKNFTQNLTQKQNEIDNFLRNKIEVEREKSLISTKFRIKKFIKLGKLRETFINQPVASPALEFKKILRLAKNFSEKNNSKLYFVYLPEFKRYKFKYDQANYKIVKNIIMELDIPFIDLHQELFQKVENPLKLFPFELLGHYNINGYKKVAETIYKFSKP
tara:strand:+ start:612 stop:1916 length:1305 start_codon:yes stop_codon:yes gene_type:complete